MDRKEQIILAAWSLAAENGLQHISMAQIAQKLGIRKPSLYNHFRSKDELIEAMYQYLRQRALQAHALAGMDYGEFVKDKRLEEVLTQAVSNYIRMSTQNELFSFYKAVYSARATDASAAKILAEETRRMLGATKHLFYALQSHNKLCVADADMAATSFAMTVHAMMDYQLDCACAGEAAPQDMLQDYIQWFCKQYGGIAYEQTAH